MLTYPPSAQAGDVVEMDLLKLPKNHQGLQYLLVCVDIFCSFVASQNLNSICDCTYAIHATVLFLHYTFLTPHILSDNGTEFRNTLLSEICSKYIKQTITVAYHLSSNGHVKTNRKIIEALRHVIGLHDNWKDRIPQVALA